MRTLFYTLNSIFDCVMLKMDDLNYPVNIFKLVGNGNITEMKKLLINTTIYHICEGIYKWTHCFKNWYDLVLIAR